MARLRPRILVLVALILPVMLIVTGKPMSNGTCYYSNPPIQCLGENKVVARAMLSDWGGSSGTSGTSGQAGLVSLLTNGVNLNGGTVPAPKQRTPNAVQQPYGGSVPAPKQLAQPWQGPNVGTVPWSGSQQYTAARQSAPAPDAGFAPPVQAGPARGGRQEYEAMDPGMQAATDQQWLGGDSDYTAQLGEYDRALQDFITRITGQKDNFELDRKNAEGANNRNMETSTNQLGEDFGARGMSYSGLAAKSQGDLRGRFEEQGKNINLVAQRNNDDADNRRKDYEAENTIGRGNAKRSALARMAAQQSITDSNAGMF